jgi:hypothetical protein
MISDPMFEDGTNIQELLMNINRSLRETMCRLEPVGSKSEIFCRQGALNKAENQFSLYYYIRSSSEFHEKSVGFGSSQLIISHKEHRLSQSDVGWHFKKSPN